MSACCLRQLVGLFVVFLSVAFDSVLANDIELVSKPAFAARPTSTGESKNARADLNFANIVFESLSDNLVSFDSNGLRDIFLKDAQGIHLISGTASVPANGNSTEPDVSSDGQWIVFVSLASNLVADDHNGLADLFVYHKASASVRRLVSPSGEANGASYAPRISADGQRISFMSGASNWVANDSNEMDDAFLYDLASNVVIRVSVSDQGEQITDLPLARPQISADGRCVSIESESSQYVGNDSNGRVDYFIRDTLLQTTKRMSVGSNGEQLGAVLPGRHILRSCDELMFHAFRELDVPSIDQDGFYLRGPTGTTRLPMQGFDNLPARSPVISRNRRFLVDVVPNAPTNQPKQQRLDLESMTLQVYDNAFGTPQAISGDGSEIISVSDLPVLADDRNGFNDVFSRSASTPNLQWLSQPPSTTPPAFAANGNTGLGPGIYRVGASLRRRHHAISADGRFVLFSSLASNLVLGDTNDVEDVFLRDRLLGQTTRISITASGQQANEASASTDLSSDGRTVLFESCDALGLNSSATVCDLFVRRIDVPGIVLEQVNVSSQGEPANLGGHPSFGHWGRISGDGRFIVFGSLATNLVDGLIGSDFRVFLRDRLLGTTRLLGSGSQPAISKSGRFITWIDLTWRGLDFLDQQTGVVSSLPLRGGASTADDEPVNWPSVDDSGRYIAYFSNSPELVSGDDDQVSDVFVFDRETASNTLISRSDGLTQGFAGGGVCEISPDGTKLAYLTDDVAGSFKIAGVLVDLQLGIRQWFAGPPHIRLGRDVVARPRFSADSKMLVFSSDRLDRNGIDQTGGLTDIYVTATELDQLFKHSFE